MSTYSSIRIYISSNASILPKGFYDIIGYVGEEIIPSSGFYNIDNINTFPVVQSGIRYYKLIYYSSDGYRPTSLDNSESLHLLVQDIAVPIYQSTRDDAHLLTSADYPINANIGIIDISNLYLAYREYTMDVYQDYAIKNVGTIYDSNNIIDVIDSDFVLVPTNTDEISITPEEGLVESLHTFTLTFQTEVLEINRELINKISLYDGNTNNIAISVDVNSINQTSSTTVTFSLLSNITSPSTYYLYLPTGLFYYSNGSNSAIAIFAYSIRATEGGGEIGEYIQNPTQGKELRVIKLTFPNISTVFGLSTITQISLTNGSVSESWDSGDVLSASGNVVTITLPNTYINSRAESVRYTITIPANTIAYTTLQYNNSPIILYYDLLPEGGDLPTGSDEYSVNFIPVSGNSVYSLSYLNIFIHLANRYGLVNVTDGRSLNEIFIKDYDGNTVGYVRRFEEKTPTTEGEHLLAEFDCSFDTIFNSSISYTITIPEGLFSITSVTSGVSTTLYNPEWTLTYNIIQENPDTGQGTDSISFYHNLIKVQGTEVSENIAFKVDDTIYINRSKLASISTWPILSITKYDEFGSPESKELLMPSPGDIINVSIRATYYNIDNVLVSTTNTIDYGYIAGDYNRYDVLKQLFREIGTSYPNYLKLHYSFTYNQQVLEYDVELQIIPNVLFLLFKNNQNLQRNVRIDLYSGSLTDIEYGCLLLTGEFDSVLSYDDAGTIKYVAELVPTTKVRTGNLSGIYNYKFGDNQPNGFGLYGENVFLTGNFYLNNGKSLMDISDDILLANGNIKEVEDGLKNLDTSVKATIEALTEKQENFEAGLDTSIKNYISTNKNAVLKIGLDYSLWSLGSAGIAMINPNATYDFDPISGNYTVNSDTVGDGDEYITLQGNKIQFSTYKMDYLKVEESEEEYMEVICTTISPELWIYPDKIYTPYITRSNSQDSVAFFLGYVKRLPTKTYTIAVTDDSKELLKYVRFASSEITDDNNFAANQDNNADSEYYTFSTYYLGTPGEYEEDYKVKLYRFDEENAKYVLVDATESIGNNTTIYYIPRVVTAGMFKDGKFNADYIEAKNLVAVDLNTVETVNDTERLKYKKNPKFKPYEPINQANWPVLQVSDNSPAKDANYVVVSGTTGKITAKGASINGTIIVGDDAEDSNSGQYVMLTDGVTDTKGLTSSSGLYLVAREWDEEVQRNTKDYIVARFNGAMDLNPTDSFTTPASLGDAQTDTASNSRTFTLNHTETAQRTWVPGSNSGGAQDILPSDDVVRDDKYINTPGTGTISGDNQGNSGGSWVEWTQWSTTYKCGTKTYYEEVQYLFEDSVNYSEIVVPAKSKVIMAVSSGSITIKVSYSQDTQKLPVASISAQFGILDTSTDNMANTLGSSYVLTKATDRSGETTSSIYTWGSITLQNDTNEAKTYKFGVKVRVNFSANDGNSLETKSTKFISSNYAQTESVGYVVTVSNFHASKGQEGFLTTLFGNGLTVGYNYRNYFTTYFVPNAETPKMVLDFKCSGTGMKFDNGAFSYYIFNKVIPAFITIIKGKIYPKVETITIDGYSSMQVVFYYFNGFTALSTYNNNSFYAYTTSTKYLVKRPPFVSNYYRESSGILWWHDPGEDHRGQVYNTANTDNNSGDSFFSCTYSAYLDLFIVAVSSGSVLIALGEKWNGLINNRKAFLQDTNTKIVATGIGKGEWSGYNTTNVPYGSLFPMIKPTFTNENGITCKDGSQFTLFKTTGSTGTVSYDGVDTSTPKICNAMQIDLADDSSFNDGSFYLDVDLCPNNFDVS